MSDLIGRLITQMSLLLTRRYRHRRTCPTALPLPMAAPPTRPTLPTHRSPYGLDSRRPNRRHRHQVRAPIPRRP